MYDIQMQAEPLTVSMHTHTTLCYLHHVPHVLVAPAFEAGDMPLWLSQQQCTESTNWSTIMAQCF
jgi:hypothetical protein